VAAVVGDCAAAVLAGTLSAAVLASVVESSDDEPHAPRAKTAKMAAPAKQSFSIVSLLTMLGFRR
jgi:hypothetical protein